MIIGDMSILFFRIQSASISCWSRARQRLIEQLPDGSTFSIKSNTPFKIKHEKLIINICGYYIHF